VMATVAAITSVSDAPKPNVPVRSAWSAITPIKSAAPSVVPVACQRVRVLAQAGIGAVTGSQAVPSQRQRPSGDSWPTWVGLTSATFWSSG